MREVNLMARRARNHSRGRLLPGPWLALGAVIVVAWLAAGVVRVGRIGREVALTQAAIQRMAAEGEELVRLANEYEVLQRRAAEAPTSRGAMPPVAALALMSRLVPEQVELEAFDLKMPGPDLPANGSSSVTGGKAQLQVKGAAVNDAATVELLKNLTACPFVAGVRAEEQNVSSPGEDHRGRFSIVMELRNPRRSTQAGRRP